MARFLLYPSLLLTSSAAALIAFHSLFFDEAAATWTVVKVLASLVVLAFNVIAFIWMRSPRYAKSIARVVFHIGAFMIAIGSASFTWTLHLAIVTGDMESGIALINLLVAFQGYLILWLLKESFVGDIAS